MELDNLYPFFAKEVEKQKHFEKTICTMKQCYLVLTPQRNCCMILIFSNMAGFS
jgi:hypothetical protein